MAAPINTPSTGDIWHLCIDDLLAPLPEKTRLGGPGPFVINLSASTAPIDLPSGSIAGCQHGHVYQVQRTEDRRVRYRLRFGPIATEDEADAVLEKVRDVYPSALTATADADDLRAIAGIQAKVTAQLAASKSADKAAKKAVEKAAEKVAEKAAEKAAEEPAEKVAVPQAAAPVPTPTLAPTPTPTPLPPLTPSPMPSPTVSVSAPRPPVAEDARESEMPTALAPPVLTMEHVIRERGAAAVPPVSPPPAAPATSPRAAPAKSPVTNSPVTVMPAPARRQFPAPVTMIPLLTTVASSSIKRVFAKRTLSSVSATPILTVARTAPPPQTPTPTATAIPTQTPPAAVTSPAPAAIAVPIASAAPVAAATPGPAGPIAPDVSPAPAAPTAPAAQATSAAPATSPAPTVQATPPASAAPAAVAAAPPAAAKSAPPPVEQLSLRDLGLETTQTVRALTAVELQDDESLRWFVIQLSMADEPFDSETVPNLDIFSLYRLYCVSGVDQGRVVHTLRLGFFSEEIAAGAVASYLAEFYENPTVKRVSVAERQRFAEQRFEPRKDVGATGKQAVIEITNERYIREKRTTPVAAHPPVSQRSR
jgi:sporulation related protein